jgi:hypothetical protein
VLLQESRGHVHLVLTAKPPAAQQHDGGTCPRAEGQRPVDGLSVLPAPVGGANVRSPTTLRANEVEQVLQHHSVQRACGSVLQSEPRHRRGVVPPQSRLQDSHAGRGPAVPFDGAAVMLWARAAREPDARGFRCVCMALPVQRAGNTAKSSSSATQPKQPLLAGLKMPCGYAVRPSGVVDYWEEAVCERSLRSNCYCYALNAKTNSGYCIPGYNTVGDISVDFRSEAEGGPCADAMRKVRHSTTVQWAGAQPSGACQQLSVC